MSGTMGQVWMYPHIRTNWMYMYVHACVLVSECVTVRVCDCV